MFVVNIILWLNARVAVAARVRVRVKVIGEMKSYPKNLFRRQLLPKVMGTFVYFRFLFISWCVRGITGYERVERVRVPFWY